MTREAAHLPKIAHGAHPNCFVCGGGHPFGLQLEFARREDGSVEAAFDCREAFEGYPGLLHGGIIASLLDGAMTCCLFAHGRQGVTGELKVRFRHPVATGREAMVKAWIDRSYPPYHLLKAELIQGEWIKAKAAGTFVERALFEAKRGEER
jgi:hypothetical protein